MSETVESRKGAAAGRPGAKLNLRLIGFIAVICLPVAWMTYTFIKLNATSGIEQVGDYKRVDLKSMGNFPFNEVSGTEKDVPEIYRKLDGQKLLLIGQMYVDFTAEPMVDRFQLVYSIQNCCFNGPPKVQERVFAHIPADSKRKIPVFDGLVEVYGTIHVKVQRENGRAVSVFDMDVEKLKPYR